MGVVVVVCREFVGVASGLSGRAFRALWVWPVEMWAWSAASWWAWLAGFVGVAYGLCGRGLRALWACRELVGVASGLCGRGHYGCVRGHTSIMGGGGGGGGGRLGGGGARCPGGGGWRTGVARGAGVRVGLRARPRAAQLGPARGVLPHHHRAAVRRSPQRCRARRVPSRDLRVLRGPRVPAQCSAEGLPETGGGWGRANEPREEGMSAAAQRCPRSHRPRFTAARHRTSL